MTKQKEALESAFEKEVAKGEHHSDYLRIGFEKGWNARGQQLESRDSQVIAECEWTGPDNEHGPQYETACGGFGFSCESGDVVDNGFTFCPFCGRPIKEMSPPSGEVCECGHRYHIRQCLIGDCSCTGYSRAVREG